MKDKKEEPLVDAEVLVSTHTHQGKACEVGQIIKITADQKKWLSKQKKPVVK